MSQVILLESSTVVMQIGLFFAYDVYENVNKGNDSGN
jgi:hypothetical protein